MLAERYEALKEANRLISQGSVNSALRLLLQEHKCDPGNFRVARTIGRIYLQLKRPEKAAEFLRIAVDLQDTTRKRNYNSEALTGDDLRFIEEQQELEDTDESELFCDVQAEKPVDVEEVNQRQYQPTVEETEVIETSEAGLDDWIEDELQADEFSADFEPDDDELTGDDEEALWMPGYEETVEELAQPEPEEEREFGWDDFEDFDDDYQEEVEDTEFDQSVPPEIKARQKAAELIEIAEWNRNTIEPLGEFFLANSHGLTRRVVTEYVCVGLCLEELFGAWHLRNVWEESEHYWMSFSGAQWTNETGARYSHLSWVQAIDIVRSFRDIPSEEELETFLEDEFEYWYTDSTMRHRYPAFVKYLKYRTARPRWSLHEWEQRKFAPSVEERFETDHEVISANSHCLQHLLVELQCDPFIEKVPQDKQTAGVSLARYEKMLEEMSPSEKRKFIGYA